MCPPKDTWSWKSGVKRIFDEVPKWLYQDSNPGPLGRQSALNISTGPLALRTFQTAGPVRASTLYLSLALQDHRVKCRASRLKITVARSMTNFATFSCILCLKFRYAALNISTGPLALRTFQTAGPVRASTLYLSLALQDHRVKCRASRLKITVARSMTNLSLFHAFCFLNSVMYVLLDFCRYIFT